jgi:hypothetical protein
VLQGTTVGYDPFKRCAANRRAILIWAVPTVSPRISAGRRDRRLRPASQRSIRVDYLWTVSAHPRLHKAVTSSVASKPMCLRSRVRRFESCRGTRRTTYLVWYVTRADALHARAGVSLTDSRLFLVPSHRSRHTSDTVCSAAPSATVRHPVRVDGDQPAGGAAGLVRRFTWQPGGDVGWSGDAYVRTGSGRALAERVHPGGK